MSETRERAALTKLFGCLDGDIQPLVDAALDSGLQLRDLIICCLTTNNIFAVKQTKLWLLGLNQNYSEAEINKISWRLPFCYIHEIDGQWDYHMRHDESPSIWNPCLLNLDNVLPKTPRAQPSAQKDE